MINGDGERTADIFEEMIKLKYRDQIITENRYIFKARIQSILILMQIPDPVRMTLVQQNLENVLANMINYCEGQRTHPFLEEVVLLYAAHMESTEQYLSAMALYSLFLRIQQNLFGEDCEQMIKTYKTMATLSMYVGHGGATSGQKFLTKAQELIVKHGLSDESNMSPEEIKESKEQQSSLYFQQYLAAEGNQQYEEALEYIEK
jgi:hypothetical protein